MLGCHSAEAVMVGDRMDTDVISGMESGMSTVLVLSGCSTKDTLKTYAYLPTMVLKQGYRNPTGFRRRVKVAGSGGLCYTCVMGTWKSKKQTQIFVTVSYYFRMQVQKEIADVNINIR